MDSSKTSHHQNRCTCKVKFAWRILCLKLYKRPWRVEPSQPASLGVRVCGCRGTRRTHMDPLSQGSPIKVPLSPQRLSTLTPLLERTAPFSLFAPSYPASKVGCLLSLAGAPLTPTLKPITRVLVENDGANGNARCGSCRPGAPGGGAGGGVRVEGLGALWSEERAEEAAAAAFAVARLRVHPGTSRPFPLTRSPEAGVPALPAATGLSCACSRADLRDPGGCPFPLSARCPGRRRRRLRAPRGPGRDRHTEPGRAVGAVGRLFSQPSPPPSLRRRGCALRRGSRETPPPPRYPRPSPLHTRTHYRAGSHTLARLPLRASVLAGIVQGPRSHHVHCLLLFQFLSDSSSPAAEDAAQRRGFPARHPRRRERERCGRRRRELRPGCGSRPASAAHSRHGALPAPAGQPAQSHAPARRRRLAGQPPGARRGPRPQPAQPDAAADLSPDRAGAAGQGPPETVPREPPEEQLTWATEPRLARVQR